MHTAPTAVLRYQAQLQQQQQEVPAAAPPASGTAPLARNQQPASESVDDILGEILKDPAPKREDDSGDADGDDQGDGDAAEDEPAEAAEGDAEEDDADPETDEDDDDAAPADDEAEPDAKALKAARKALKDGDLDKAFDLAFGKKPEEVQPDSKAWTAWRKANERRDAQIAEQQRAVDAKHSQNQAWVQEQQGHLNRVIEQLRPYDVYFQLEQQFSKDGDYGALVKMVEHASKLSWDEAQKLILTKTRLSPGERALKQKYEELVRKLEGQEQQKTEAQKKQEQQQAYQGDLATIRGQLTGEVAKVPQVAERVYQVLANTRLPTGGLSMTIEEAGRRVLAAERRKLEKHPLLKKPTAKDPKVSDAASTLAKARKNKNATSPPLRRDSHGNGAKDEKTETIDDILGDILPKGGKRRAQ